MALTPGGPVPGDALTERAILIRMLELHAAPPSSDPPLAVFLHNVVLPALRALPETPADPLTGTGPGLDYESHRRVVLSRHARASLRLQISQHMELMTLARQYGHAEDEQRCIRRLTLLRTRIAAEEQP